MSDIWIEFLQTSDVVDVVDTSGRAATAGLASSRIVVLRSLSVVVTLAEKKKSKVQETKENFFDCLAFRLLRLFLWLMADRKSVV